MHIDYRKAIRRQIMLEKDSIKSYFSKELQWIKDTDLRDKVMNVWLTAADIGGWKNLDEVPFTLLFQNSGRLIDHTRRVTNLAKCVMDQRSENINQDYLVSGALLHDVGKLLEYTKKDGKIIKSEYGEKFRHPVSGSLLAKECGIPDEVVFIIYAHSHEGDNLKRSPEAIIVNHCDFIDFEIKKSQAQIYED
jgi:putative nucleotidyltransferase with HDIG domain